MLTSLQNVADPVKKIPDEGYWLSRGQADYVNIIQSGLIKPVVDDILLKEDSFE